MSEETKRAFRDFQISLRKEERERLKLSRMQMASMQTTPQIDNSEIPAKYSYFREYEKRGISPLDVYKAVAKGESEELRGELEEIPQILKEIRLGGLLDKHVAVVKLRRYLSTCIDLPIQTVIDSQGVPALVELLKNPEEPHLRIEAAWCITNIASGSTPQVYALIESGVVPLYSELISETNISLLEQIIWGIGNMAADNISARDWFINCKCIPKLVTLYNNLRGLGNQKIVIKNTIWAASNLCRSNPTPPIDDIFPSFDMFAENLFEKDSSLIIMSLWSLSAMADQKTVNHFLDKNLVKQTVKLLSTQTREYCKPCLKILGVFTCCEGPIINELNNKEVVQALQFMLYSSDDSFKHMALMAMLNLFHKIPAIDFDTYSIISKLESLSLAPVGITVKAIQVQGAAIQLLEILLPHHSDLDNLYYLISSFIEKVQKIGGENEDYKKDSISGIALQKTLKLLVAVIELERENYFNGKKDQTIGYEIEKNENTFLEMIEEKLYKEGLVDLIENLQSHASQKLYEDSQHFIKTYLKTDSAI